MADGKELSNRDWLIYQALCIVLIAKALWRILVPGGEWPLPPAHYLSMGIDALLFIALIGMKPRISPALPAGDRRRTMANALFWPALLAGAALLLIRFTGDAAWWTGHLRPGI